jgi:glycosyltransferase involved in cell wall biosynthesis
LHVVQIGYDDTVFLRTAPSDTRARQALYAALLAERRPGSRLTLLVLARRAPAAAVEEGALACIAVTGPRPLRAVALLGRLLALHRRLRIDVLAPQTVFTDGWIALAFAAMTGVRVVGQLHFDLFSPWARGAELGAGLWGWRRRLALRLLHRFDELRVVSRHLAAEIRARALNPRVSVVPVPALMPASSPAASSADADALVRTVLYVGRLAAQKNLSRWLRVARRIADEEPDVEFQWAGDGPLRDALLAESEALGLGSRLRWFGAMPHGDLPALYARASVFLLTSDYEGLPRVAVEAGQAGLPMVAPALPGLDEVIASGETGFLCPPDDEAALAAAALSLLRDADLRRRMSAAARARVGRDFDPRRLAERWVDTLISAAERA